MKKLLLLFLLISYKKSDAQNFDWIKTYPNTVSFMETTTAGTAYDLNGNIYYIARYYDTIDVDPGPGVYNLFPTSVQSFAVTKFDALGNFIWAFPLNFTMYGYVSRCETDNDGNLIIVGYFRDSADVDPGPAINMINSGTGTAFLLKIDANKNFKWFIKIPGGSGLSANYKMNIDNAGNILLNYGFIAFGNVDFDPGPGVFNISTGSWSSRVYYKIKSNGTFGFAGHLREINDACFDESGNVYLVGKFNVTTDFDPSAATYNLTPNFVDGFISKLDSMGNFQWVKHLKTYATSPGTLSSIASASYVQTDSTGAIYVYGEYLDTTDFDPGPGVHKLCSPNYITTAPNSFLLKLDSLGNFNWVVGTLEYNFLDPLYSDIRTDKSGNTYFFNQLFQATDVDPDLSNHIMTPAFGGLCLIKINSAGNFVWASMVEGLSDNSHVSFELYNRFDVSNDGHVLYASKYRGECDFDPGAGIVSPPFSTTYYYPYLAQFAPNECSNLSFTVDSLEKFSCASGFGKISTQVGGGTPPYLFTWDTSPVQTTPDILYNNGGSYNPIVTDAANCTVATNIIISPSPSAIDMGVNLVTLANSTFSRDIVLDAFNYGCIPQNGTLTLILNSQTSFTNAVPPPDYVNGDTLLWNFDSLVYDMPNFTPHLKLEFTGQLGDSICVSTIITPLLGDSDTLNNKRKFCFVIAGPYDPNHKYVFPEGECEEAYILPNQKMTYTLVFQNVGNAPATNVYLDDPLDIDLNFSTVRVVSSSHPMETSFLAGNTLRFLFNNINLPDSFSNEPESHGYVIFEVEQNANLPLGTIIENTTYIYFDFEPAVITNTVLNTVVNTIPSCVTAINEPVSKANNFAVYPNPAKNQINIISNKINSFKVFNSYGQEVLIVKSNGSTMVDITQLAAGIYTILSADGEAIKFIKTANQ
jgi:uncharacterized repeat protein (TIGR01451 family)